MQICVQYGERSKGPLVTSLAGIGTSGGPAAPLVNMLLLSGPQQHTPRYMLINTHTYGHKKVKCMYVMHTDVLPFLVIPVLV